MMRQRERRTTMMKIGGPMTRGVGEKPGRSMHWARDRKAAARKCGGTATKRAIWPETVDNQRGKEPAKEADRVHGLSSARTAAGQIMRLRLAFVKAEAHTSPAAEANGKERAKVVMPRVSSLNKDQLVVASNAAESILLEIAE